MSIIDDLFSPLSKKYCVWFYYLEVFCYILFIVALFGGIIYGVQQKKSVDYFVTLFAACVSYFVMYFQNRLFYSMCVYIDTF